MDIRQFGWDAGFEKRFDELGSDHSCLPARVVYAQRQMYRVVSEHGEHQARVSGRLRHQARLPADYPVTGDWVGIRFDPQDAGDGAAGIIHFTLPRKTWLSRRAAGQKAEEQLLCANIDRVFLVSGLDRDFNLRRIERYLSLIYEGGAAPVIVLNKIDLCSDLETKIAQLGTVAFDLPVICISALSGAGIEQLDPYLQADRTVSFVGSSGAGKSTLINRLLGREALPTAELRANGKGRHTTTHRELFLIPGKGMVIDNPGMRELQLWAHDESLADTFAEIEQLAGRCRFVDCTHAGEPGCAVRRAIKAGDLDAKRLDSYLRQKRELELLARTDGLSSADRSNLRRRERRRWEKEVRTRFKDRY
ncbi:MAG: ribosome small subunit-dependent GTPase A [Spirochaetales bacterium]|nr:ribosome small subunit-dependent GTPase A [Spirochaetales bacterium]